MHLMWLVSHHLHGNPIGHADRVLPLRHASANMQPAPRTYSRANKILRACIEAVLCTHNTLFHLT